MSLSFEELYSKVTRPESRVFKPYSVPQSDGFGRMHQNESFLPLEKLGATHLFQDFLSELQRCWSRSDGSLNVYPSLVARELNAAYAEYLEVPESNVEVFSGSSEALLALASGCFKPGAKVAFLDPSFSLLADLVQFWGAEYVPIALDEGLNCVKESLFSESVLNADVVILCTPNNPTGGVISRAWIQEFISKAKGLVVIDEAYFEFAFERDSSHPSFVSVATAQENVIVLRTLSKAWGVAGLRIGALVGNEKWVRFFAGMRRPYSIPSPSEVLGTYVLTNKVSLMKAIVKESIEQCEFIVAQLSKLATHTSFRMYPSQGNFLLIDTPLAKEVSGACFAEKLIVRSFQISNKNWNGETKKFLRVSPWSPVENQKFVRIMKELHSHQ